MELRGARALVTGASSGIGAEISRTLAAGGVMLALSGRRRDVLDGLANELAGGGSNRPAVFPADLGVPEAAAELGLQVNAALGGVDVLVNCAGGFETGSAVGDGPVVRALFETNYWAPLALARTLAPGMQERRRGAIVNVSSIATVTPLPSMGSYPASKAALATVTEALRIELAGSGVQVTLAFLGGVDTPMHAKASRTYGGALRRMPLGRADAAARIIVRAIRRGRATVVYPRAAVLLRWLPTISTWVSGRVLVPLLLGRVRAAQGEHTQ